MSGSIIAVALASIIGLLAVWLWLIQSSTVNTAADLARAEQRCEQARFDLRFDSTLAASNPQTQADAARVQHDCVEVQQMRAAQAAAAASQAEQMQRLQQSLSNLFKPASQPSKNER